ncbi:hypothetical protein ACIBG8_18170 [Nonomuraea sp. NPDC050556]|uniref:hypothetical protein n=1 Tax=Nonomuraea sp. NPDC050556 TaxID=3364369 RepID=UPI00378D8EF1
MRRLLPLVVSVLLLTGCGGGRIVDSDPYPAASRGGQPRTSGLSAGSVDDNARFREYLSYLREVTGVAHPVDVSSRRVVTVVDSAGRPLPGAVVRQGAFEARTYADGRALVYGPGEVTVEYGDAVVRAASTGSTTLPVSRPAGRPRLQVLFLIDTTGSMGDEIERLKATVGDVASRIGALGELELGMTLYRDRGDEYVVRTTDFTASVESFRSSLSEVTADAGSDTPEDVNAGLHAALGASWRAEAVKLLFLIGDAPPHLDYQDGVDYVVSTREAARRAIKIMPVASSGLDATGEYVFRQLAQQTMGRFTFLTYGPDGRSTEHHVSDYAVLALDDLIVRLVKEELKPLT